MSEPNDDAVCVAECLRGDTAAFGQIVTRHQRVLFSVALRMVGNHEDARDTTQNAFIRAFQGLHTYHPAFEAVLFDPEFEAALGDKAFQAAFGQAALEATLESAIAAAR